MNYLYIILITFISGVIGTGIGGLIGAILNKDSNRVVSLLLSFAGGIMLAVVCFDLIPESFEVIKEVSDNNLLNALIIVIFILIGYLIVWGLNILIDKKTNIEIKHIDNNHPDTADDLDELIHSNHLSHHKDSKKELFVAGIVMMLAIALHNLPEGMVIGASYATNSLDLSSLFKGSGFVMALVIGLHNIPEGMSVSVPLISGGMKKGRAILLTALSGLPIVIGALIGYALGEIGALYLVISLCFASGAMLYVILGELLPESILMWKSKIPALTTFIGLLIGVVLVIL